MIQEEEIIVRNWKKRKLKLKTCQKLQSILDEQELSVQPAADTTKAVQICSWGIMHSPKPGNWPLQYISENKYKEIVGVPC